MVIANNNIFESEAFKNMENINFIRHYFEKSKMDYKN